MFIDAVFRYDAGQYFLILAMTEINDFYISGFVLKYPVMMMTSAKQFSTSMLQIYLILALLFLTSVTLHIHTQEAAVLEDHGAAVSISSITGNLSHVDSLDEIVVSPESALKLEQNDVSWLAVFLLFAVIVAHTGRCYISRLWDRRASFPVIPFYGAPLLRAPPL